jgi:hypothetical protein
MRRKFAEEPAREPGTTGRLLPSNRVMRPYVVLTSLCLVLLGCGGNEAPQTFTIRAGETTYENGVAREGDKIVCVRGGERLGGAVVPKPGMGVAGAGLEPVQGQTGERATGEGASTSQRGTTGPLSPVVMGREARA